MVTAGTQKTASSQYISSHSSQRWASRSLASRKRMSCTAVTLGGGSVTAPLLAPLHHAEPPPVDALQRDLVIPAVAAGQRRHAELAGGLVRTIDLEVDPAAH